MSKRVLIISSILIILIMFLLTACEVVLSNAPSGVTAIATLITTQGRAGAGGGGYLKPLIRKETE
ncbi:MAG: hypothetical protein WAV05_06100 [Anaerolineales bacterium]